MTLTPLINTDPVIQLHIASALLALLLGPIALYRTRRDSLHRWTGYLWVGAMFTVALSSFWIHHFGVIGPFSPIHLLAVLTLWSLVDGMRHAFARPQAAALHCVHAAWQACCIQYAAFHLSFALRWIFVSETMPRSSTCHFGPIGTLV